MRTTHLWGLREEQNFKGGHTVWLKIPRRYYFSQNSSTTFNFWPAREGHGGKMIRISP